MAVLAIYAADESTSDALGKIVDLASNPPSVKILCDDTYLTESETDKNGRPIPNGGYQLVSQWVF
jgi:hypothetical protein